ncbi:MAG: 30S ribosomal protein S1 [Deltaproteobacteria bacterium]
MGNGTDEIIEEKTGENSMEEASITNNSGELDQSKDEGNPEQENPSEGGSFMELYEESLRSIQEGEVVKGEIVQVDKEYVLVDIGYKSEGQIRIEEFIDAKGDITAKAGDKVEVLLERKETDDGLIILSKEKAAKIKIWDEIKKVYEEDRTIRGKIVSRVKGGLSVDIGLQAFLPGSQVDLRPIRDMDSMVGTEHDFKIVKYNKRRGNIVLSRRAILEAERLALRENTLKILKEGSILEGTVKNITDYGLFVDLGGIDGLVQITDMSWGRVGHPSEMYQVGDTISVKVLNFDAERERVSLGVKQLTPDPWSNAAENYPNGTRIQGKVVSLTDYGAFVEIEEGVEGLIHVSEMSWTRKVRHPSQLLSVGDMVDVMVLNMDAHKKRISLGMKQVEPNPWDVIAEKYPVGTTIEGKIKNITDFGIFIGIDEGIDGLVHISDISWTRRIKHPSEVYKKGEEVQAVVLNIDKENERFSLGIKQLVPDPWNEIPVKYKPGTRVTGTVTNVTDFGIFVELEEGIEGLIHVSELPKDKKGQTLSRFQVDDVIQAKVVNISAQDKKIGLSIRKLEETSEKGSYSNYLNNNAGATSNLGELLKEEMMHHQMNSVSDVEEESKAEPQEDEDTASAASEADTPSEAPAAPVDESESGDDSDEKSTEDTAEVSPEKTDQAS